VLFKNKDTRKNIQSLSSEMGLSQILKFIFPSLHSNVYGKAMQNQNHESLKQTSEDIFWETMFLKFIIITIFVVLEFELRALHLGVRQYTA
jgi:hypothetical protein